MLKVIESFIAEGVTDLWLPFSQNSFPSAFQDLKARSRFLETQRLVFNSKALGLERAHTEHGHFREVSDIPFRKIGELGKGGCGYVDRVISTVSHREYARKLIPRGKTFKKDKQVLRAFEQELSNLKTISRQHLHIIDLIGSYTDPKFVAVIMSPVADCNLNEFLTRRLNDAESSLLRTFFGCLTSAVVFPHDSQIRHKDIKPQNILVKNGHVLLTDFGISLNWSELSHSTTTGPTYSTPRYCAPEVANHAARSPSADIWSLGCVFLEIWTVLKGKTTRDLLDYMANHGSLSPCYCLNPAAVHSWIDVIRSCAGSVTDNLPSSWITRMLQLEREAR